MPIPRSSRAHPTRPARSLCALLIVLAGVAAVPACKSAPPPAAHVTIGDGAEPLRARFNQDAGQVRVVMIVAPT